MFFVQQLLLLLPNVVIGSSDGLSIQAIINHIIVKHDIRLVKVSHISNVTDDYVYKDRDKYVFVPYMINSFRGINFSGSFIHIIETDGFDNVL